MASPSTVITAGFGNGTLAGSPSLIITMGYGIGAAVTYTPAFCLDLPQRPTRIDLPQRPTRIDLPARR